jgi:pantetheine-phosphate adenylyltransferase
LEERTRLIEESCADLSGVEVTYFSSLVVDLAAKLGAEAIVKGLRSSGDFESELRMAQTNKSLTGIETILLPTDPEVGFISSTYVREISRLGGDATHLVPEPVKRALRGIVPEGSPTA